MKKVIGIIISIFWVMAQLGLAQTPGLFINSGQNLEVIPGSSDVSYGSEVADMDGDGDLDLIFGGYCSKQNAVWLNDGAGNFTVSIPFGTTAGAECEEEIAVGDVDGDGDVDAVVSRPVRVFLNDGSGTLTLFQTLITDISRTGLALGDLDGDGDLDLFNGTGTSPTLEAWENDGSGTFALSQSIVGYYQNNYVNLGDLDGDGDIDAIAPQRGASGAPTTLLFNDGSGTLTAGPQSLGFNAYSKPPIADFNGDGFNDIFIPNNSTGASVVWINDGTGTFVVNQNISGGISTFGAESADLDGDGDMDLFLANSGPNSVWLNDGTGTFSATSDALGSANTWNVALGDFNGDGSIDAGTGNPGAANQVWFNLFIPAPIPTIGEWGLIILALLILNFGAISVWRSQREYQVS